MVAAIIGGIATLAPTIEKYANLPNASDPGRFTQAQQWYGMAINGNADALCKLKYMSGDFGCATCGTLGYSCGFATDVAKDYDGRLYNQAVQVLGGTLPKSTPIPAPPGASQPNAGTVQTISQTAGTIADVAGAVATATGTPTTQLGSPTQTRERLEAAGWVALALVGGVLAYFLILKRR